MLRISTIVLLLLLLIPAGAPAIHYICKVEKRSDLRRSYSNEQIRRGQYSVRLTDERNSATLRHCAFETKRNKISCDPPQNVEHIAFDPAAKSKKFYLFRNHSDVQIFADLRFIENNGHGTVSFGSCTVAP